MAGARAALAAAAALEPDPASREAGQIAVLRRRPRRRGRRGARAHLATWLRGAQVRSVTASETGTSGRPGREQDRADVLDTLVPQYGDDPWFAASIAALEPVLPERARIRRSRAQFDLVEATLLRAYLALGRMDAVQRLLQARRPGPAPLPVAGSPRCTDQFRQAKRPRLHQPGHHQPGHHQPRHHQPRHH